MTKNYVNRPIQRDGKWCVVIVDGPGPFAKELEAIKQETYDAAYNVYDRIRKGQY